VEQAQRREEEQARAVAAMKSRIETVKWQTDQTKALRVAESRAARTAKAAAALAVRERSVAQKRAVAAQGLAEETQLRQQAEERQAKAVRQKIEAEQALEASIEKQKRIEQDKAENREGRAAASATLRHMRKSRYGQAIVKLVQPVRNVPALRSGYCKTRAAGAQCAGATVGCSTYAWNWRDCTHE